MSSFIVLCDRAKPKGGKRTQKKYDETISISRSGRYRNLHLEITNITHRIVEDLTPRAKDLIEIASFIYYADGSAARWSEKDVFGLKWIRDLHFVIPVRDPKYWNALTTRELLSNMLSDLTGDRFSFEFQQVGPQAEQLFIDFPHENLPAPAGADCVCLFSGGLDSFAGVVDLCRSGHKPLLVSHRSSPKIDSRQKRLVGLLKERMVSWSFPHLNVWVNRKGNQSVEQTQRSRSFLFLSLAGVVCNQLNLSDIFLYENGIITFNIPLSGQNVGSMLSRSTHPKFVKQFQELLVSTFKRSFKITNPFVYKTKNEVVRTVLGSGCEELMKATVSCAHTLQSTTINPHCGTCSQCVDRRFAFVDVDLSQYDESSSYEKDIFTTELEEGEERTHGENYVRSALKIEKMNDSAFFQQFPELQDSLNSLDGGANKVATEIYSLFKRHSSQVLNVVDLKWKEHGLDYIRNNLPPHCLVSMIAQQYHSKNPVETQAYKLGDILEKSLRYAFQKRRPSNERDVQNQIEAALSAAKERLVREYPYLLYSVVQTKPDFATKDSRLFIEAKYVDDRKELNGIIRDITSRVLIYREQGAQVLFFIFDNGNVILDDDGFSKDIIKHQGIFVKIAR
jgi:7-cyano-7-deazaguanine synthase in queuosine biosynthesis